MNTRLIIATALLLLASAATAQVTNETPLSQPQYGFAPNDQTDPLVASDGTNFLVAWIDHRGLTSIYANRVTAAGEVLDGTGIRIPADLSNPASQPGKILGLFHIDGAYTLIYKTFDLSSPPPFPPTTQAVIISDDGQILDGPHQILDRAVNLVASNGNEIVIVDGGDLFLLNGRGEVSKRLPWSAIPGGYGAALASNGSSFLFTTFAAVGPSNTVNLIAFDAGGETINTAKINGAGAGESLLVKSDGADYVVLYFDVVRGTVLQSVTAQAEIRSTLMRPLPLAINLAAVSWTGLQYLLASRTIDGSQQMSVMGLDRNGSMIGSMQSLEAAKAPAASSPAIAGNRAGDSLVAWTSGSYEDPNGYEIHAALVDANGSPRSSAITVPKASNAQALPAIATGGVYDLAVWVEPSGIYASRVTSTGAALDGRGTLVYARPASGESLGTPHVVFDGTAYLVAWGSGNIKGQRIDPATGAPLAGPMQLSSCASVFDLGYDGISPVLFVAGCSEQALYSQRVGPTGVTGSPVPISPAGVRIDQPHAAWNGHEWLVAWTNLIQNPVIEFLYRGNVYASRLSSTLTLLDTQPIDVAVSPFDEEYPLVASDGHDFVIIWTHLFNPAGLYVRHIHSDGTTGEASLLVPASFPEVSLAWNGLQYTLAYKVTCSLPCQSRSYLTHFDLQSEPPRLKDSVPIGDANLFDIAIAGAANGRVRIVYSRNALEPLYGGSARVFLRDDVYVPRRRAAGR